MLAAAIATWAGGPEGWRWAWYLLGIPVAIVAIVAFKMKEPPRGQFEKDDVLGEVIEDEDPAPISMESAFARIKKIATIKTVLVAFCALGFGLFSQGELASLYLNDNLHIHDVLHRGLILSLSGIAALPLLPFVGQYFDRVYRMNPAKALAMVGALILPSALFTPLQYSVHSSTVFWILGIPQAVLTTSAFAMTAPGAAGGRAVPAARHGHRDGDDVHLLHRRVPRRRALRASSRTRSASAAPSSRSACRRASSAACC